MKISGAGKRKTDPGYGEGVVQLDLDDDALLDEEALTERLLERFSSPSYVPPKLPSVAAELMSLAQNPEVKIDGIVALLEKDQMLAGQVMKIVQSPVYSGQAKITSLNQALVRIGLNTLRDLVFQASMNLRVFRSDAYADTMDRLRRHSAATAHLCRIICKYTAFEGEYAFLCGLMHDVGIAATLIALSDPGPGRKAPDLVAVWPAIDRVHTRAGALITELWELPAEVSMVIGAHHQVILEGYPHPLAAIVCIADQVAREQGFGLVPDENEVPEGISELEAACLESHANVDASLPKTLEHAREALSLTDKQMQLIHRDCEDLQATIS